MLAPVMLLKSKRTNEPSSEDMFRLEPTASKVKKPINHTVLQPVAATATLNKAINEYDWDVVDEYDPLWPNEYDKIIKERREKDQERRIERDRNRREENKRRVNPRYNGGETAIPNKFSGFGGRPKDDDDYDKSPPKPSSSSSNARSGGAAIAPPPSLQEIPSSNIEIKLPTSVIVPYGASSVAAKIMAKYGFKDGQGLGKQEQGMSVALQVEKTSKRGGRIIHENDFATPNAPDSPLTPSSSDAAPPNSCSNSEPSITEIMKTPSKVVLLRVSIPLRRESTNQLITWFSRLEFSLHSQNMVGPGDVDNDLEPEVKDECNTKYGEVASVIINEIPNVAPEEAVRIFVEFKRIESAIKAVVDVNGRFFGGRQVRAGFFSYDKFKAYQLND